MTRRRLRGETGQAGGLEAIPFGLLVFLVGTLVVTNAWAVVDAKVAVTAAAREAARAYVEAPTGPEAARAAAGAAADAMAGHGRDTEAIHLEWPRSDTAFGRCLRVAVTVRYQVPAITLPWIGGYGNGIVVRATHTEVVDPFRRGLDGTADCA